jgi:hypothetical protein
MKLIAKQDFRNVAALGLKEDGKSTIVGTKHDDHIHKGAVFDIGPVASNVQELAKKDRAAGQVVAMLISTGAVGDANDPTVVQSVKDDIAADEKRTAAADKLNAQSAASCLGDTILSALSTKKAAK